MCHLAYTNFQRQGAVLNMTAGEVMAAQKSKSSAFMTISVWQHKTTATHGSAHVVVHMRVYQLLLRYSQSK